MQDGGLCLKLPPCVVVAAVYLQRLRGVSKSWVLVVSYLRSGEIVAIVLLKWSPSAPRLIIS